MVEWKVSGDEIVSIDESDFKRAEDASQDSWELQVLALCARRLDDEEDMYDMEKLNQDLFSLA